MPTDVKRDLFLFFLRFRLNLGAGGRMPTDVEREATLPARIRTHHIGICYVHRT